MYILIECEMFLYFGSSLLCLRWIGLWSVGPFGWYRIVAPKALLGT